MNNKKTIDHFLKQLAYNYQQGINLSADDIYYLLTCRLTTNNKESNKISDYFENWIDYYKDNDNIIVENPPEWKRFCTFESKEDAYQNDYIKIYAPLDYNHIEKGAKILFDYISQKGIAHISKIASQIRFDNIVIRVTNKEDAKTILSFIQNNKYIKEGLIQPNPFAFNHNNIALACDGSLSYNTVVSDLLKFYFDSKNQKYKKTDAEDFYNFVLDLYNDMFLNKTNVEIIKDFKYINRSSSYNLQTIIQLVLKANNPNFTLEDYFNQFEQNLVGYQEWFAPTIEKATKNGLMQIQKQYNGDLEAAKEVLELYVTTGQIRYITRKEGLRAFYNEIDLGRTLQEYLKNKQISLTDFLNDICSELSIKKSHRIEVETQIGNTKNQNEEDNQDEIKEAYNFLNCLNKYTAYYYDIKSLTDKQILELYNQYITNTVYEDIKNKIFDKMQAESKENSSDRKI